jgi:osmotically inducible protein OsmC
LEGKPVPRVERTAQAAWSGNLARGKGELGAGGGAFTSLGYSVATRLGQPEGDTSPEELFAAAHVGCLTMAVANMLTTAGTPPGHITARCRVVLDEVGELHEIVSSQIDIEAAATGLDETALEAAVAKANEGCVYSMLLRRAGADVGVSASVAS